MADAISGKRNAQTYLRQVQQEKAQYKRELAEAQRADIKAVRDHYAEQNQQLESEAQAAVVEIKEEARQAAAEDRQARAEQQNALAEERELARQDRQIARGDTQASESSVEKKNVYSKSGQPSQRSPLVQNYDTKETDNFYRVQDRGSRLSEGPGYYIIEAYAPEHEKDNLRVSIQRGKAVISGQRKFADEATDGSLKMSTKNYQSFREEFKFDRPVSGEGMRRERIGDYVRFEIPKLEAIDDPTDQS